MSGEVDNKQAEDCFLHLMLLGCLERLLVSALHQAANLPRTQKALSTLSVQKCRLNIERQRSDNEARKCNERNAMCSLW